MNPHMWDLIISVPIMAILPKCKLTSVFSWMEPSMNLHASPCDKNGQVNQGVTGTLMQFRNWKRLLRSSVDHYGIYRFARLRIVSLQDLKSSDPYETGPTNPSWSEVRYICKYIFTPLLLSQSLLWVQIHSVFNIISRHACWHHSCAVLLYGSLKVLPFSKREGYRAWCVSIPTSSALG